MKLSRDIQSLSTFKRDTSKLLRQMKETGQPLVLTVNGKAAAVVIDPDDYEHLQERDRRDAIEGIRRGMSDLEAGRGRPAGEFFDELFVRFNIPRRQR
jgi:prevent-host-death family protein